MFVAPLRQPGDELRPLRFCEHEIADGEFTDVAFDKRTGKIFRRRIIVFDPAFANLNVAWRGWPRRESGARGCGLEFNQEGILGDVIPDAATAIISRAQQHARLFASADGRLSIEVELTQRFNLVAVEFNSQRQGGLP